MIGLEFRVRDKIRIRVSVRVRVTLASVLECTGI